LIIAGGNPSSAGGRKGDGKGGKEKNINHLKKRRKETKKKKKKKTQKKDTHTNQGGSIHSNCTVPGVNKGRRTAGDRSRQVTARPLPGQWTLLISERKEKKWSYWGRNKT